MDGYRAVVPERGVIEIEGFEVPEPAPNEIVIRARKSLISPGTERAFFLGLPNAVTTFPMYPGYNNVGEVIQVGANVTDCNVGDRVASVTPHASHVVAPIGRFHPVPAEVPDDDAVFFHMLTISMQAVRKTRLEVGEPAAVIGVGPIGLLALQAARAAGALPVIAIDADEDRLTLAREHGADVALVPDDNLMARLHEHTGVDGVPVVIEATGNPAAVVSAFQMAAMRGRVSLLGSSRGETDNVNFYRDVHKKGLTIIGAHADTCPPLESSSGWWTWRDEHRTALKLMRHKRVNVAPLISHHFSGEDFTSAYELLQEWDRSVVGILIDWTQ